MDNNKLINNINQLFHNAGIKQEDRFDLLIKLLENNKHNIKTDTFNEITELINLLDYTNKDMIQEIFMLMGSKYTKFNLDQFYTPLTISKFISKLMISATGYNALDPAGGTGDLLLYYDSEKTIWDIDTSALKLCKFNYELNKQTNYNLVCKNSLEYCHEFCGTYSYVVMNPPFGSSTIVTEKHILDNFELGKGKKKQEIGILFIELGLKMLKNDGILFTIVPAGYAGNGNANCVEMRTLLLKNRLVASIKLPENTFKRSGTGVNTYLLIIQKKDECVMSSYPIFISSVNNIGYNLTKKNTPLKYKIIEQTGDIVHDSNNNPILDNDFEDVYNALSCFCNENKLVNLNVNVLATETKYEYVEHNKLCNLIIDVKRYLSCYLDVVYKLNMINSIKVIDFGKIITTVTKIDKTKKYNYIDIGEINSPLYGSKELYGWQLPSRAKYTVKKFDILVSKLEGSMSYCTILDDNGYIATNGVTVIRPNNMNSLFVLMANIVKSDFEIQHKAFMTGSIMASLSDTDIGEILIDDITIDVVTTQKILETLELLYKIKQ
jgi:type I restriction-modification system DNA methylase subunit